MVKPPSQQYNITSQQTWILNHSSVNLSLKHFDMYMSAAGLIAYDLGHCTALRDVTPGPLSDTDTYIVYKDYPSYALRKHMWERVVEGVGEQRKQKPSAVTHVIIVSF
jgi:hypothetical protein